MPCLGDRFEEGGVTKSEYFWQDLVVARLIHEANPLKHVDVGSRIDGFVAHVACFREVEVFDIRPVSSKIPGIVFRQVDITKHKEIKPYIDQGGGYCDSLSCLHVLEHFGLGRYGDPIDPQGYAHGFDQLVKLIKPNGHLYLSTPIGKERVEFNANWVFDPRTIMSLAKRHGLVLECLTVFGRENGLLDVVPTAEILEQLADQRYNLGIFIFKKTNA